MGFAWRDNLVSLISSLGQFGRDPAVSSQYAIDYTLNRGQLEAAYRGNWIARKCIDIPADDATRMWRRWIAEDEQVTKLEGAEKEPDCARGCATRLSRVWRRRAGDGGRGLRQFLGRARPDDVKQGALKFVHVITKDMIAAGPVIRDLGSPWFVIRGSAAVDLRRRRSTRSSCRRTIWTARGRAAGHSPSRVIRLIGLDYPDEEQARTVGAIACCSRSTARSRRAWWRRVSPV